jgi:hypothetical protein
MVNFICKLCCSIFLFLDTKEELEEIEKDHQLKLNKIIKEKDKEISEVTKSKNKEIEKLRLQLEYVKKEAEEKQKEALK